MTEKQTAEALRELLTDEQIDDVIEQCEYDTEEMGEWGMRGLRRFARAIAALASQAPAVSAVPVLVGELAGAHQRKALFDRLANAPIDAWRLNGVDGMTILAALAERAAVPAGWKMVPIEPTPEMVEHGVLALFRCKSNPDITRHETAVHAFRSMLAAAPSVGS